MKRRAVLIVLDSVGIGALPDAHLFGDEGAHTLANIFRARGRLHIPHLRALGLAHIAGSMLEKPDMPPTGAFGRAAEITRAKDTTSGHWELMGLMMEPPFRTYPDGFPIEFIHAFEARIGKKTLWNRIASGTEIINRLGDEHVRTGHPIVYTSADSVFQIAAHEGVIPLDEQYRMCQAARDMLTGDMLVGRVIARPFEGESGAYRRTQNRRDYALPPPGETVLDALLSRGRVTVGIGKIEDIFCHRGLSASDHTHTNAEGIDSICRFLREEDFDFLFANLVDFDMLYGHRNDVEGYAAALEAFDARLDEILGAAGEGDIILITADHGCDPTTPGTDHTREYIPLLIAGHGVRAGVDIGTRKSFADAGATIYEYLTGESFQYGESFLEEILA